MLAAVRSQWWLGHQLNAAETVPSLAQAAAGTLDRALASAGHDGCVDSTARAYLSVSSARAILLVAAQLKSDRPADRTRSRPAGTGRNAHPPCDFKTLRARPRSNAWTWEALGRLAVLRGDYARRW